MYFVIFYSHVSFSYFVIFSFILISIFHFYIYLHTYIHTPRCYERAPKSAGGARLGGTMDDGLRWDLGMGICVGLVGFCSKFL